MAQNLIQIQEQKQVQQLRLTQQQLAELSGVNVRQIRRVEIGEAEAGNLTAKNLLSLADALSVDPHSII